VSHCPHCAFTLGWDLNICLVLLKRAGGVGAIRLLGVRGWGAPTNTSPTIPRVGGEGEACW